MRPNRPNQKVAKTVKKSKKDARSNKVIFGCKTDTLFNQQFSKTTFVEQPIISGGINKIT